jgi:phosphate uptake regulator
LPKRWIEEMHLKSGDQVALIRETDNSLSILPFIGGGNGLKESLNEVTAEVLPDDSSNAVKRKVVSMYLAGYDVIHLKIKSKNRINPALRDGVREIVRRNLIGTEIIADASDSITLQVLMSTPELSISTAIRRMYLIALSMHRDAMLALREINLGLAKEVIKSDDEVDRFSLYILRNLVKAIQDGKMLREMGLENASDRLSYRVAAKSIERVADHACGIADKATKLKGKIPEESLQKIEKMSQLAQIALGNSVEALLRRDYQLADKTVDAAESVRILEGDVMTTIENCTNMHDQTTIRLTLENIRRTAEYASDIAEVAINETIDQVTERHSPNYRG